MAFAIENTIPCDRCNTQIVFRDWAQHIRNCSDIRNNRPNVEERRTFDDQSDNDRMRCEFCYILISGNEWKSHSKICAEKHKPRVEDSNSSIQDEPIEATIPCEYCYAQISIHELERHTRQCAGNQQRQNNSRKPPKDEPVFIPCEHCNTQISGNMWEQHTIQCANDHRPGSKRLDSDESILIPCEYCHTPVDVHELERHTKKCAREHEKRISSIARQISKSKESFDATIPCEFCGQPFTIKKINAHEEKCQRQQTAAYLPPGIPNDQTLGANFTLPENWDGSATKNLTRYNLDPGSNEYRFAADKFHETLPANKIVQIERIQNRRWYRQYDAHKDDFTERYGKSTEQWLFHGCRRAESAEAIIRDCFNRSHAVNCAVGQGIYFATKAVISLGYTHPDAQGLRHMFMARVLVGKTTRGDRSTRVCPPGFDTTGTNDVFVTYHDAQAYAQYLIVFR